MLTRLVFSTQIFIRNSALIPTVFPILLQLLGQGRHLPRTRTITADIVNDAFGADIDDFLAQNLHLLDCATGNISLTSQSATTREGHHPNHVGGFTGADSASAENPKHELSITRAWVP